MKCGKGLLLLPGFVLSLAVAVAAQDAYQLALQYESGDAWIETRETSLQVSLVLEQAGVEFPSGRADYRRCEQRRVEVVEAEEGQVSVCRVHYGTAYEERRGPTGATTPEELQREKWVRETLACEGATATIRWREGKKETAWEPEVRATELPVIELWDGLARLLPKEPVAPGHEVVVRDEAFRELFPEQPGGETKQGILALKFEEVLEGEEGRIGVVAVHLLRERCEKDGSTSQLRLDGQWRLQLEQHRPEALALSGSVRMSGRRMIKLEKELKAVPYSGEGAIRLMVLWEPAD